MGTVAAGLDSGASSGASWNLTLQNENGQEGHWRVQMSLPARMDFVVGGRRTIEFIRPTLRQRREGWGTRAFAVVRWKSNATMLFGS
jgi:hypothetical protein